MTVLLIPVSLQLIKFQPIVPFIAAMKTSETSTCLGKVKQVGLVLNGGGDWVTSRTRRQVLVLSSQPTAGSA